VKKLKAEKPVAKTETKKEKKTKESPAAKAKKPNTVLYIGLALAVVLIAAGIFIVMTQSPQAPDPGTGSGDELDANVLEKEMSDDVKEELKGARSVDVEEIDIVQGAESVPSELISPLESEETEKFEDLNNLVKVVFELTDKDEVTFEEVSLLEDGRISLTPAGDYSVQLFDKTGKILYELPFNAIFFIMGNPPEKIESMKFVFVLPRKEGTAKVAVAKEKRILAEKEVS